MIEPESLMGGYRVLDLTDERGLLCGKILGYLGADVIKIEKPGGDLARNIGPFYKDIPDPEKSLFWFYTNLNKRGITLNIESADGKEIFKRLVKSSDFVIESSDPGYMDSLGLGYATLEQLNPRIILTSITPFGQTGPYVDAKYKASNITLFALSGRLYLDGYADRPPVCLAPPQAYFQGGLHGALGSMVAHYHRELTGEGQHVDVAILAPLTHLTTTSVEWWALRKRILKRGGLNIPNVDRDKDSNIDVVITKSVHRCKDGSVHGTISGGSSALAVNSTSGLVKWANEEGMLMELADYDWTKYDAATMSQEEVDRVDELVDRFFLTKTMAEVMDASVKRRMTFCPIVTMKEVLESPQLAAREHFVQVEHPELGATITYPGCSFKLTECPWRVTHRPPLIGEHNKWVYEDELGFTKQELTLLKSRGVI